MDRLVINGQTYMRSLDKAYWLVAGFCLFDLSYEQYDLVARAETASFDPETAVRLARAIRGRGPLDNQSLIDIFASHDIKRHVSTLKELELDSSDDTVWPRIRRALESLFAIAEGTWGISHVLLTKALHPFCSKTMPLLDNLVIPCNYPETRAGISQVEVIRNDLMTSGDALRKLQSRLRATGIRLSRIRIFDMILWARYRSDTLAGKSGLKMEVWAE